MAFVYFNNEAYTICPHALKRMAQRGIKKDDIQSCLDCPSVQFSNNCGYSIFQSDHSNGRTLHVVLNPQNKQIVTVLFLGD